MSRLSNPESRAATHVVNTLSWLFIAVGSIAAVIILGWLFVPQFSIPAGEMAATVAQERGSGGLMAAAYWVMSNSVWFLGMLLVGSLVTVWAATALLKRQPWARQLFVGLMSFGFVAVIGGVALTPLAFGFLAEAALPEVQQGNPLGGMIGVLSIGIMGATVLVGIFGWVGWKLTTPAVRAEFEQKRLSERGSWARATARG